MSLFSTQNTIVLNLLYMGGQKSVDTFLPESGVIQRRESVGEQKFVDTFFLGIRGVRRRALYPSLRAGCSKVAVRSSLHSATTPLNNTGGTLDAVFRKLNPRGPLLPNHKIQLTG